MSDEGERTCPLCTEEMDLTDQQLKPCRCGYDILDNVLPVMCDLCCIYLNVVLAYFERMDGDIHAIYHICVWCWHQILEMAAKEDTEGRCPACRVPYDKEKIVGMAANCERMVAEINMERKKSQKAKTKSSEGRKQLGSVRVIQRNLVYIVGLPLNLADEDLLQRREYFGQYGKVLKVSMSRTGTGVIQQFPNNTCSVYITYSKEEEAIRCIQSVHGFVLDGRSLKACFGTTKYCHAWLRNVPCTNPDCLYLHEIGSQEDSFTKDEIVSAFTRSRVQQITGATNNMLRRAGGLLPPPVDDYCCNGSVSAPKPIVKVTSNNSTSTSKSSPPNGSSGRSIALPAAASWGTRATNQPQSASSTSSNGPAKLKSDTINVTIAFSSAVTSSSQVSTLHNDLGKRTSWNEDGQTINGKVKPDSLKPVKQNAGVDSRANILEKLAVNDDTATVTLSNQSSSPTSEHDDWGSSLVSNGTDSFVHTESSSEKEGIALMDVAQTKVENNGRSEFSAVTRISSSLTECSVVKSSVSPGLQQAYADKYREPLPSMASEKNSGFRDQSDWRTGPQVQTITDAVSEVEEDILSFDNQRHKDPEFMGHTTYLPSSANSLHVSNLSRSHSLQHNEPFGAVSVDADPLFIDRVADRVLNASSHTAIPNGYPDKLVSSSSGLNRNMENYSCLPNEGERKHLGRLQGDVTALDVGENSIISNILSLDLDSWDESLTSPQHLAKLLGETDKQPSSLKMSTSWKGQNNHQSRFSFARQEELRSQGFDADPPFSVFGQLQKNPSFSQESSENRLSYLDKFEIGNSFSSINFDEPRAFVNGPSVFSSSKPSVSRAQFSAPPGFSVPNRAPPPGFSSHERMDQIFDTSGSHLLDSSSLLRNPYQAAPTGNISSSGDIEFMDPAILAVGKGRLQGGLNNQGLDVRSTFPQQLSAFEDDPRLQLLMQRSLSPHQNLRYNDIGDSFSSLTDSYGISSRLVDQSQISNLSPFMPMSFQHTRNGLMSNGHWDGWNELQGGNGLGVAEFIRNERLGLNKFYSAGYEESKFRMPNSGDLYNRNI